MASPADERPPPLYGLAPGGVTTIILWSVFTLFLSTLAVMLRFWARNIKNAAYAWNDWAAVIALVLTISLGAVSTEGAVNAGLGAHEWELVNPEEEIIHTLKDLVVYQYLWASANTFVRLSVLHLYITIFRTPKFRLVAQILTGITVVFLVAIILETSLFCMPFEANWNPTVPGAHCGNIHDAGLAGGTLNLALDFVVVCLPMPALWNLQLPLRKKLALVGIFGIGFSICALSIVRIVSLSVLGPDSDLTYDMSHIGWWSILEPSLGIINCCLPVLQPVASKLLGTSVFSRNRSTNGYRSYGTKSIHVVTEHQIVHSRNDTDDEIPLQSIAQRDYKYRAEVRSSPHGRH